MSIPSFIEIPSTLSRKSIFRRIGQWNFIAAVVFKRDSPVDAECFSGVIGTCIGEYDMMSTPEHLLCFWYSDVGEVVVW